MLFVLPDNLKKEYWSETELSPIIGEKWNSIVSNLLDISVIQDETCNPQPIILGFTPEAKQLLFEWQRQLTDQSNNPGNEAISGICAKIELYAIRLALCLEMVRFACKESYKQSIGIEAVQGAIKLVEYFKRSALKVHSIISNANPLDKFPPDKQTLYHALPDTFTTSEGVKVAESLGIKERTLKRFIKEKELFDRVKHGEYEKLY